MEIELAQVEMPGLMSMIKEFGPAQPLKGANISGSAMRYLAGTEHEAGRWGAYTCS